MDLPPFESLDCIFFSSDSLVSGLINFVQKNALVLQIDQQIYSHVGLILKTDILSPEIIQRFKLQEDHLYLWESTMSGPLNDNIPNVQGQSFLGVQLRDFEQIRHYYQQHPENKIAYGKLKIKIDPSEYRTKLSQLFEQYNGRRYDANIVSLASTVFDWCRCCRPSAEVLTEDWLFCSELVSLIYQACGIIDTSINVKNMTPMDLTLYCAPLKPL